MKRILSMSLFVTLLCAVATAQQGQRPGQGRQGKGQRQGAGQGRPGGGGGGSRPGSAGSSTLEGTGLKLGQALPDLTIFDDKGGKVRLADLKGKHSVIVFGCLT